MLPNLPADDGIGAHGAAALDFCPLHHRSLQADPHVVANDGFPGVIGDLPLPVHNPVVVGVGDTAHTGEEAAVSDGHLVGADDHCPSLDRTGTDVQSGVFVNLNGAVIHQRDGAVDRQARAVPQAEIALCPGMGVLVGIQVQVSMEDDFPGFVQFYPGIAVGDNILPLVPLYPAAKEVVVNKLGDAQGQQSL